MEPIFKAIKERMENGDVNVYTIHDGKEFLTTNPIPQKLHELDGVVKYKYYARKWSYSCAQMMHNKFID